MNNKTYELLHSVEDRLGFGEVTTPPELINKMLDTLPSDTWTDKTKTFLDPCFGNGTFLIEIIKRLRSHGHSMENIESRVSGYEISVRLFNKVQKLLSHYNFSILYNRDFLNTELDMKFDVVIGNPPYNGPVEERKFMEGSNMLSGSTVLSKKFTECMINVSGRFVITLQPYSSKTYGKATAEKYKDTGLYLVTKVSAYFPNVDQSIGCFYFDKELTIKEVDDEFVPHSIPVRNLGELYITHGGRLSRKDYEHLLSSEGNTKVIVTPNTIKYTNDPRFHETMKDTTFGTWRVAFAANASMKGIGKIIIAKPEDILSGSTPSLSAKSEEHAVMLKDYLNKEETQQRIISSKTTKSNSKKYFEYVELPTYLM
tara:strand:- start:620 stop:1729 length:1110 start_codon:yes stop_codon:yes gene_type:complete